ncbi:MAG TPA: PrsW family glutamic-type intramembrane protease [Bacteroidia bacterium]
MILFTGIFICVFLAFIWIEYFRRIDVFEFEKKWLLVLVFLLGLLSPYFVNFIRFLFLDDLQLQVNGDYLNDFIYCLFGVALVEEIAKFLPFLIVLMLFRKHLKETVDYLVYAALGAIGFACHENVLYFVNNGIEVIAARSVTSVPAHIFDSVIFVYGLMVYRFHPRRKDIWMVISFMAFAVLSHALYDFFLVSTIPFGYMFMLTYYMILISVFVGMLGNALNNSEHFNYKKFIDSKKVTAFMLYGYFLLFFLITIAFLSTHKDDSEGSDTIAYFASLLWKDLFIILVLVFRISRFKIIPGRWNKIRFEFPFTLRFREIFTGPPTTSNLRSYLTPNFIRIRIKGESYSETYLNYFFDRNIIVQPVIVRNSFLKKSYKGILDLKLFLKDDEVFYVLIIFSEEGTEYFYIKAKSKGRQRFGKNPIVALMKGPPLAEINEHHEIEDFKFLEWVVLKAIK